MITSATLGNPPIAELVRAASAAGFGGLSVWPGTTWERARADGWTDATLRRLLADHGLVVHDVDAAIVWAGHDDPGPPYFEESPERVVIDAAHGLGATVCNLLVFGRREVTVDEIVDALEHATARFAAEGLELRVEFTRGSALGDLTAAARAVRACAPATGVAPGVVLDIWHHHTSGGTSTIDPLDAEAVRTVQLSDVPPWPADLRRANRHGRLPAGTGIADVARTLRSLRASGATPTLVVEALNDAIDELGPLRYARHLAATTEQLLAQLG